MNPDYKITVIVQTAGSCPPEDRLKAVARKTLEAEGVKKSVSLNLLLTDDAGIRKLNKQFLGEDRPTDVMAFPSKGSFGINKNQEGFIGDVVISVGTAAYNSKRFNTTREHEVFLYIIHGILHILGYRDENKKSSRVMEDRQERILEKICQEG